MNKLIRFSCIGFALCLLSCSNDMDFVSDNFSDKIVVEQVSSPEMTRSISEDSIPEKEAIYTIKYKDIVFDNVSLLPSIASRIASAKALEGVYHLTLTGYTKVVKNPDGRKGGDYFQWALSKDAAQRVGLPQGTYICRDVFFIHEYDMGYSDFHAKIDDEVEYTYHNMGFNPESAGYGFKLAQEGSIIRCKTRGTLIEYTASGEYLNICYPVTKDNMTFKIKYIDIIDF